MLNELSSLVNPNMTMTEFLRTVDGIICLIVAVLNSWDAALDARLVARRGINGMVALAARDERQAERFRIAVAAAFVVGGLIQGITVSPEIEAPRTFATFCTILGLTLIGLSSVRARWNRKRQIAKALAGPWYGRERRRHWPGGAS